MQQHPECAGIINIADGAAIAFRAVFGWIPSIAYTALFELLWLAWHCKTIRKLGSNYKGRWISILLIILAIPFWLYEIRLMQILKFFR